MTRKKTSKPTLIASSIVKVSATTNTHSLSLTTRATEPDVPVTLQNLLKVTNDWGDAVVRLNHHPPLRPDQQSDVHHKKRTTVSPASCSENRHKDVANQARLFTFATALEGLSLEEGEVVKPPADTDVTRKFNREEKDFYNASASGMKNEIVTQTRQVMQANENDCIPQRFRVLFSNLPLDVKKRILQKLDKQNESMSPGDAVKYAAWVDALLSVPLGLILVPSLDAGIAKILTDARVHLDTVVYGHKRAKHTIIDKLYSWLRCPMNPTRPIALYGPPGNGKTTLMKYGLAPIMNRPFSFISLGGAFDSSFLLGHGYTYEGSQCGRIAECLMQAKCMNPILYFDELDKVSESPKGEEIINTLVHLTDGTQMDQFRDRYLQSIPIDMTKVLFVFSFNNISKINPILLDRLQLIETDEFTLSDQQRIITDYLLPATLKEANLEIHSIAITDLAVQALLQSCDASKGVRQIRSILEQYISKLSMFAETKEEDLLYPMTKRDIQPTNDENILPSPLLPKSKSDESQTQDSDTILEEHGNHSAKIFTIPSTNMECATVRPLVNHTANTTKRARQVITQRGIKAFVRKTRNDHWKHMYV